MNLNHMKHLLSIFVVVLLSACEVDESRSTEQSSIVELLFSGSKDDAGYEIGETLQDNADNGVYPIEANELAIKWDELVPADYRPDALIAKYQAQLKEYSDYDPRGLEIYRKIQAELDNAPLNDEIQGREVRLPGFIAPLSLDEKISEFLLVPYFGACIHVPPPPLNQTIYVKTRPDQAIDPASVYEPFWVQGIIQTEGKSTEIGKAGDRIMEAGIDPYLW